jgi:hypothetical protein
MMDAIADDDTDSQPSDDEEGEQMEVADVIQTSSQLQEPFAFIVKNTFVELLSPSPMEEVGETRCARSLPATPWMLHGSNFNRQIADTLENEDRLECIEDNSPVGRGYKEPVTCTWPVFEFSDLDCSSESESYSTSSPTCVYTETPDVWASSNKIQHQSMRGSVNVIQCAGFAHQLMSAVGPFVPAKFPGLDCPVRFGEFDFALMGA